MFARCVPFHCFSDSIPATDIQILRVADQRTHSYVQTMATMEGQDNKPTKVADAHQILWDQGLTIRREVVGQQHVERSLSNATSFSMPMQEYATEIGWGWLWSRPGLQRKQRSLLNIAMLSVLGRSTELGAHVRGAVRNGVTEVELRETLLQAAGYAGFPVGMEGFRVTEAVLKEMEEQGELPEGWRQAEKGP
jgi:4-carboxymuconolactone decarboxylase